MNLYILVNIINYASEYETLMKANCDKTEEELKSNNDNRDISDIIIDYYAAYIPTETVRQKCLLFKHLLISRVRIGFLIYQKYSVQNSLHGHSFQST